MHDDHSRNALDQPNEEDVGELGDKVQRVRAELESLKQKQEAIEREKARLEELKRRQESLEEGRADMLDKITRALVVVQRETAEAQKRVEQLHAIHGSFTNHLRELEVINPKSWGPGEMANELSKSLSAVESARAEYIKCHAKLEVETGVSAPAGPADDGMHAGIEEPDFLQWVRNGFAFTLPLQVLGLLGLLVWIWTLTAAK